MHIGLSLYSHGSSTLVSDWALHPSVLLTVVTVFFITSGPLSWAIPAELFGTAMRLKGVSWGAMTSFAFNTMIGQVTPIAITSIGWVSINIAYQPMSILTRAKEILSCLRSLQFHQCHILLVFPTRDERSQPRRHERAIPWQPDIRAR